MAVELRISVVIPVYNAARFVEAAAASALRIDAVKEVILVDDGGPDNSLEVCRMLAAREPRVRLLQHPGGVNRGASESRNLGMREAREELIAFLDADDRFLPNRFEAEAAVFAEHPDADGVYGAIAPEFHDAESQAQFEQAFYHALTTVRHRVPPEALFDGLIGRGPKEFGHFSLDGLTLKRSALDKVDPWLRSDLNMHEDTEFLVRLAWHGRLYPGVIDRPVALRGVHPGNRFVRERSHATEHLLYAKLRAWAAKAGVERPAREHIERRYAIGLLLLAPTKGAALRQALRYRRFMPNYAFRDALFTRLAGAGSRLHRWLHKATWRIYR